MQYMKIKVHKIKVDLTRILCCSEHCCAHLSCQQFRYLETEAYYKHLQPYIVTETLLLAIGLQFL